MTDRTLYIRGPLSDADLNEIVAVVKRAEEKQPAETFSVLIDLPEDHADVRAMVEKINPLSPGYERKSIWTDRRPPDG
jgi:hypothetical protein